MVHNPAGFWIRFLANLIDGIILAVFTGLLSEVLYQSFLPPEGFTGLDLVEFLYYLLLPILWVGYTVGKKALGIRIARIDGGKVGIGTMLLRLFVSGLFFAFTLGIGVIVSAFMVGLREDKRGIHDFIAGTYVTFDEPDAQAAG